MVRVALERFRHRDGTLRGRPGLCQVFMTVVADPEVSKFLEGKQRLGWEGENAVFKYLWAVIWSRDGVPETN